ncbi:hypothetical protein [Streptomyces sp. NPDC046939]|uniref:hypothetical protein n=1 Tax=Streptomyces sp. NPDC046939 TaxID=3155376 RepID=UPI0034105C1F
MAIDPDEPETFAADEPQEIDVEAPEADIAEQLTEVAPVEDDTPPVPAAPDAADEGDLAEQARVVALDEDDYR